MNKYSKEFLDLFNELSEGELLGEKLKHEASKLIRRYRKEKGMTQSEFAEFMGVNQSMISKWESHDYNFSLETLGEIFAKLGKNISLSVDDDYSQYIEVLPKYSSRDLAYGDLIVLGA